MQMHNIRAFLVSARNAASVPDIVQSPPFGHSNFIRL